MIINVMIPKAAIEIGLVIFDNNMNNIIAIDVNVIKIVVTFGNATANVIVYFQIKN